MKQKRPSYRMAIKFLAAEATELLKAEPRTTLRDFTSLPEVRVIATAFHKEAYRVALDVWIKLRLKLDHEEIDDESA